MPWWTVLPLSQFGPASNLLSFVPPTHERAQYSYSRDVEYFVGATSSGASSFIPGSSPSPGSLTVAVVCSLVSAGWAHILSVSSFLLELRLHVTFKFYIQQSPGFTFLTSLQPFHLCWLIPSFSYQFLLKCHMRDPHWETGGNTTTHFTVCARTD